MSNPSGGCGCYVQRWNDGLSYEIVYCSMHSASEKMLEALKEVGIILNTAKSMGAYNDGNSIAILNQAIEAAQGKA